MLIRLRDLMALIMLCGAGLTSSWAKDLWLEDPITGCKVWTNTVEPPGDVVSWDGDCVGGKANGYGTLSWFSSGKLLGRYQGSMALGRLHGKGTLFYAQDKGYNRYEGDFVAGELEGWVIYDSAKGDHFEGEVKKDGKLAQGVFVAANGEWYQGSLKDGVYDGKGVLVLANGDILEGSFVAGEPHGPATYTLPDGSVYEGNFVNGKVEGTVILTSPDGTREKQTWRDNKPVGKPTAKEKDS